MTLGCPKSGRLLRAAFVDLHLAADTTNTSRQGKRRSLGSG